MYKGGFKSKLILFTKPVKKKNRTSKQRLMDLS